MKSHHQLQEASPWGTPTHAIDEVAKDDTQQGLTDTVANGAQDADDQDSGSLGILKGIGI